MKMYLKFCAFLDKFWTNFQIYVCSKTLKIAGKIGNQEKFELPPL